MVEQLDSAPRGIQQVAGGSNPASPLHLPELYLEFCSAGDSRYALIRKDHYVVKKGNHGQQVHFMVWYKGKIAGIISGGGAVYACRPRDVFFLMTKDNREKIINGIVDNTVFRLVNHEKNLGSQVLSLWEKAVSMVWEDIYGVAVFGFETFIVREGLLREIEESKNIYKVIKVDDPEGNIRRGNMYKATNWTYTGETAGSTKGHDEVGLTGGKTGKGVFWRKSTTKKDVYCKWAGDHRSPIESTYKSSWKAATKEGTPEEKALAKEKSSKRKAYLGALLYRKGKQIVCEKLQPATQGRIKRNAPRAQGNFG